MLIIDIISIGKFLNFTSRVVFENIIITKLIISKVHISDSTLMVCRINTKCSLCNGLLSLLQVVVEDTKAICLGS